MNDMKFIETLKQKRKGAVKIYAQIYLQAPAE